jgi:rhodanese-related sulfurtransferase
MIREITRQQIENKLAQSEKFALVEACPDRSGASYEARHLPNAVPLSPSRVSSLALQYVPDLGTEIVVYGESETSRESEDVLSQLSQLGYSNLYLYRAGKQDWFEAGEYSKSVHEPPQPGMHVRFAGDASDQEKTASAFDSASGAE